MKERLINIIKWFLITLGVIFLIQILIVIGAFIGIANFANADITYSDTNKKLKDIKPIINYAEDYYQKYGKYPDKLNNVKIKKDLYYTYQLSDDNNCYTIEAKYKKSNLVKQYKHCAQKSNGSSSDSQSYVEYSE